jgi:hypothetical protein
MKNPITNRIAKIYTLLFALTLIFEGSLYSQYQFSSSSAYRYSTPFDYGDESYNDAISDQNGIVYAIGISDGPIEDDYSSTNYKLFINKINPNGTIVWQTVLKDSLTNFQAYRVYELNDDSLLVLYGSFNTQKLSKFSKASGVIAWTKNIPSNIEDNFGIITDTKGKFAILSITNTGNSLTSIECFDDSKNSLWSQQVPFKCVFGYYDYIGLTFFSYNRNDYPVASFASNGDLLLGGITEYSSAPNLPSFVRLDSNGEFLHSVVKLPNSSAKSIISVTSDSDGNAYVINYIAGPKLAITKLTRAGAPQLWQQTISGYSGFIRSLVIDENLVVIEESSSYSYDKTYYLDRYNSNGALIQQLTFSHDVGTLNNYSINNNGYLVSVGRDSYEESGYDALVRFRQLLATPIRNISLNGNLAFASVPLGSSSQISFIISNSGNSLLTVNSISLPANFSADWTSGTIAKGSNQTVTITFTPSSIKSYGGNITIISDATAGTNALSCSGIGSKSSGGGGSLTGKPVITSSASVSGVVNSVFEYQIVATNSPSSYKALKLPQGLYLNASTGILSGYPIVSGVYKCKISANNLSGTTTVTLNIIILPLPPVITSPSNVSASYKKSFVYKITAINKPTTYIVQGLPAGLKFNSKTGLISGKPTALGSFPVSLTASNAGGTISKDIDIDVR